VITVALLQSVEPIGYRWTPTAVPAEAYAARHRRAGRRRFSLSALFYVAAHAHYVARHAYQEYVPRHRRH
jgi:hypothetical protein